MPTPGRRAAELSRPLRLVSGAIAGILVAFGTAWLIEPAARWFAGSLLGAAVGTGLGGRGIAGWTPVVLGGQWSVHLAHRSRD